MKIIAGLGNPGAEYASTPHSVGFETVDAIATAAGVEWVEKKQFKCLMARVAIAGETCLLVKPQTYMNLSGESISPIVKYNNAQVSDLIVVQDDIDLSLGRLRIRTGGSSGGHNGIRNIIERLGAGNFVRVKLGVGKKKGTNVISHVLGKFDAQSRAIMDSTVSAAVKAVVAVVRDGPQSAMNLFNGFDAASEQSDS